MLRVTSLITNSLSKSRNTFGKINVLNMRLPLFELEFQQNKEHVFLYCFQAIFLL